MKSNRVSSMTGIVLMISFALAVSAATQPLPAKINFQPQSSTVPPDSEKDYGQWYGTQGTYEFGWFREMKTERIVSGLVRPLFVTHAPGDTDRIFIVEQRDGSTGRIRIFELSSSTLLPTPFLSVSPVSTGGEQGLLGLTFHPDYASNGFFYVNYTDGSGTTVIERYQVSIDPDLADPSSGQTVLTLAQPYANHNGGWLGFGPDGYLYCTVGDGGSGGDPQGNAQNLTTLLGKILRIDVAGDDFPADPDRNYAIPPDNPFVGVAGEDEIWAYGLRNPWRPSFDRSTNDLWIADVGQVSWEEVNFQPASSTGGENYGWRCYEGNYEYNTSGCSAPGTMVFPIHDYDHGQGCSVTGGYVYRGNAIPALSGTYFFADFCTASIWSFRYDGASISEFTDRTVELDPGGGLSIDQITSFGEDGSGEIYICDLGGEVFKIVSP